MPLKLVGPTGEYAEQVMEYRAQMLADHDSFDGCAGLEDVGSFAEWIDFENRLRRKYGEGYRKTKSQTTLAWAAAGSSGDTGSPCERLPRTSHAEGERHGHERREIHKKML